MARFVAIHAVRVPADAASLRILDELEATGVLSLDDAVQRGGHLHLELDPIAIEELRRKRVDVEVGGDVREAARRVQHLTRPSLRLVGEVGHLTGFVDGYLDATAIHARFAALHAEFPALTTWTALPFATHGYDGAGAAPRGPAPVMLFRITTRAAALDRPAVLFVAGCHGREWVPPLAAIELAEQLLRNPRVRALIDGLDWLFVPALNPDGINFAHHDDVAWRRNRRPAAPGAPSGGVDLGRNFGVSPSAFSEPEARDLRAVVERHRNVIAAIDCHGRGDGFVRPQPGGGPVGHAPIGAADHAVYLELEAAMNAAIASVTPGKVYSSGAAASHAGSLDEYLYLAHRIFAIAVTCGRELQPPIAEAQVSAIEVAAAARALGERALALAAAHGAPVSLVHVVDRSASMEAAGHADAARSNARRLVELTRCGGGDALGLVTFAEDATVELPLTALDAPDDHARARAAAAAIGAGGWTSIGGGLQAGAALLAGAGPGGPRAIVLLSDGHENRPPTVAAVLPAVPEGVEIHAVALGAAADQPLLQDMAVATGGRYYFAPDALALDEIYNFVRADVGGEQLIYNQTATMDGVCDDLDVIHRVTVEAGVAMATFCVTFAGHAGEPAVTLLPPDRTHAGLPPPIRRDGHWHLRVRRPEAGTWRVRVEAPRVGEVLCNVAVFVRSPLRLELPELAGESPLETLFALEPRVVDGEQPVRALRITRSALAPTASLAQLVRSGTRAHLAMHERGDSAGRVDAPPPAILDALTIRHAVLRSRGIDPVAHRPLSGPTSGPLMVPSPIPGGSYNVRYEVRGNTRRTGPFVRVGLRSVYIVGDDSRG